MGTDLIIADNLLKDSADSVINNPSHYTQGGIESIDAIATATRDLKGIEAVCIGNALKYLWRWKLKNGTEDLKKAKWYIDYLLEEDNNNNENLS